MQTIDGITIIDDALPKSLYKSIKEIVLSDDFSWSYLPKATLSSGYPENYIDAHSLANLLLYSEDPRPEFRKNDSCIYGLLDSVLKLSLQKINLEIKELIRVRIGLLPKAEKVKTQVPHTDKEYNHMVAILYLTTCDGPTIIYNEKYDPEYNQIYKEPYKSGHYLENILKYNLSIKREIECIENRIAIFDGLNYHSGSYPSNVEARIMINYNFTI